MGVPKTTLYDYCMEHPEVRHLIDEYDTSLNEKSIHEIGANTGKTKVYWHCDKHNYTWQDYPANRVKYPKAPCCTGRVALGNNNALALYPEIFTDFEQELNPKVDPSNLLPYSHVRINWKCHKCGYIWDTECGDRLRGRTSCPNCSSRQTSKAEKLLIGYFSSIFPNTKKTKIDNTEFDVFIPELKVAIEYDGYPWHLEKRDQHIKKLQIANKNGIILINIAEYKNTPKIIDSVKNQYTPEHRVIYHEINASYNLSNLLPLVIDYFRQNGIMLPQPNDNMVQDILSEVPMKEMEDSLWNSTDIPWIRNWIAEEDIPKAKYISQGSSENIRITCPNCGRQWDTKVHWIKKQFRGCTKRSGGCGFQGLMGDQLANSSESFRKGNESRKGYLHNYYKNKRQENTDITK